MPNTSYYIHAQEGEGFRAGAHVQSDAKTPVLRLEIGRSEYIIFPQPATVGDLADALTGAVRQLRIVDALLNGCPAPEAYGVDPVEGEAKSAAESLFDPRAACGS